MERGTPGYGLVDKTEDLLLSIGRKLGIQNPFAGTQAIIKENREGRDQDSIAVDRKENLVIDSIREGTLDIAEMLGSAYLFGKIPTGSTVPKLPPSQHKTINVTPGGALTKTTPQRTQIPKYSSGQVVQTSKGPLIRLDPGTFNITPDQSAALYSINDKLNGNYSYRRSRGQNNPIWNNLPESTQKLFTDIGIDSDQASLIIEKISGPIPRETIARLEGGPFTERTFEFMKSELLPQLLKDMKGINLTGGYQLDHQAQLRAILPFYYGRNLKQIPKVRRILQQEGIHGGHNPQNFQYLPTNVHTVKTKFWEQQVGKDGSKFFKGRKFKTYADIRVAAKEMKAFMNRSNEIVAKVSAQYYLMNKRVILAEELDLILEKVDLNYGTYNLKEVRKLIKEIDYDKLEKSKRGLQDLEEAIESITAEESPLPYLTEDQPFPTRTPIRSKKSTLQKIAEKEKRKTDKKSKSKNPDQEELF